MSHFERLFDQIGHDLGWHDHNMRRDRPYNGQSHTDKGERGKQEIHGITMRDLRDCFIRAVLLSTGGPYFAARTGNPLEDRKIAASMAALYEEAKKGEDACLCENDLYGFNLDRLDPVAISQNLTCEVERIMGIFPNVPWLIVGDDGSVAATPAPKE